MLSFLSEYGLLAIGMAAGSVGVAQTARAYRGASPLVAIESEPAAMLVVDPPLAEQLAMGLVFIQYRADNLRIVPVFGKGALDVSPRIGHVHITVDDAPWHFVDSSGETIIVVGLPPGPHSVLVELADPTHHVIDRKKIDFVIPARAPSARGGLPACRDPASAVPRPGVAPTAPVSELPGA